MMGKVLNARERKALHKLSCDHKEFIIKGKLPVGIGEQTLEELVRIGLAEKGASERYWGRIGYRITADGWRCMYGKTYEEIMAGPEGQQNYPLKVWRWPAD